MAYPLKLGSISFDAPFEGPNGNGEGLGDLGSTMKAVIKEFPGGIMTAQLQGSVPKPIPIKGILYGQNARARSFELQKLVDDGDQVTLSWAEFRFEGFCRDYAPFVKSPYEIHFTLEFKPLLNRSTFSGAGIGLPNTDPLSDTVSNGVSAMNQQSSAPTNGYQMPSTVQQSVTSLNSSISQQLQLNGGSVSTLPVAAQQLLQGQIGGLLSLLQPMINGTDPLAASAAAELSSTLTVLNLAFSQNTVAKPLDTLHVINPNLYEIASYYYDDPTLWELIKNATNVEGYSQPIITDPLPLGTFQLIVPPNNTLSLNPPITVMSDGLNSQVA